MDKEKAMVTFFIVVIVFLLIGIYAESNMAYDKGYNSGHDDGYDVGYEEGYSAALNDYGIEE